MSRHTETSSSIQKLLIVRLGAMGDVIHTLPAAQALRDALPNAMIGWLIEERLCAHRERRDAGPVRRSGRWSIGFTQ